MCTTTTIAAYGDDHERKIRISFFIVPNSPIEIVTISDHFKWDVIKETINLIMQYEDLTHHHQYNSYRVD